MEQHEPSLGTTYLFVALGVCSLLLMVVSSNTQYIAPVEDAFASVARVVRTVANAPTGFLGQAVDVFASNRDLRSRVASLEQELVLNRGKLLEYEANQHELEVLRAKFNEYDQSENEYLLTRVISLNPHSIRQQAVINRGSTDGVAPGLVVIDAQGIFGQITDVHSSSSVVLQVNDAKHALPVFLPRTEMRSIAAGNGRGSALSLENVAASADIRVGDAVVTSGLGGRFPAGYSVGTVEATRVLESAAILEVDVQPSAKLDSGRHLLILLNEHDH